MDKNLVCGAEQPDVKAEGKRQKVEVRQRAEVRNDRRASAAPNF
jgi:hypothetical protein